MFLSRLWILVSLAIGAASVNKYKKLGDEAVLSPGSVSDPIISIIWIHGSNIAVEWYTTETVVHRDFRDRCKLDFSTGALTISNLTVKDSGVYTAEINNKVMRPTEITVISAVPKPMVSTQCRSEGTRCTFTCEASITGAEPVTYSWVIGARQIPQSSSNQLSITKDDAEIVGKPIRCQVKNPVSSARSDDVIIPFTNGDYMGAIVGGVVAFVFVIVVACGVVFICYSYRRRSQNLNEDMSAVKLSSTDMKTPGTALTVMVDQAPARTVPETQKKMLTSTNPASVWISQLKGKRRDSDHKTISSLQAPLTTMTWMTENLHRQQ